MKKRIREKKRGLGSLKSKPVLEVEFQNKESFAAVLPSNERMHDWMLAACEKPTSVVIRFVDVDEGKMLNLTYRARDYATNVLTFDYTRSPVVTADIVICVPVLVREAEAQNKTFEEHLAHLLIHGILHAHGYDHLEEGEAEVMEARETAVMTGLGFENPYSDRIGMVHD